MPVICDLYGTNATDVLTSTLSHYVPHQCVWRKRGHRIPSYNLVCRWRRSCLSVARYSATRTLYATLYCDIQRGFCTRPHEQRRTLLSSIETCPFSPDFAATVPRAVFQSCSPVACQSQSVTCQSLSVGPNCGSHLPVPAPVSHGATGVQQGRGNKLLCSTQTLGSHAQADFFKTRLNPRAVAARGCASKKIVLLRDCDAERRNPLISSPLRCWSHVIAVA